ncbi:hypothetical protein L950_0230305 [Sphingobacterium sp. IITKGP-BTPF85]|nr:hypothetical protein L950_0230305 [Sphingobacterium sp. IITKGP-BTPF85]
MASEGTNSLKISEDIKDIIADEVICFLENLEPDVTQSLRSLFADQARMKKMLIKELKRNYCINNNNFFVQEFTQSNTKTITHSRVGLGSVIAVVASWDRNKSILWAISQGILSWFYVIYFAFTR